jgi:catechol 2,3-dioxygenase-like lactoylglutathione lyase family enzyme
MPWVGAILGKPTGRRDAGGTIMFNERGRKRTMTHVGPQMDSDSTREAPRAPKPAPTDRAMEIVLEVADLDRAAHFYRDVLGMAEITRFGADRPAIWVKAAPGTYLGLWSAEAGGPGVGVHGSRGGAHIHLAFLVSEDGLDEIEARLAAAGVAPEGRVAFGAEQHSLFVHDPDGNVIEFADWRRSWEGLPVER